MHARLYAGKHRVANLGVEGEDADADGRITDRLSWKDMQAELDKRIAQMESGAAGDGVPDQARVFRHITEKLISGEYLRLMVQASAGTGASFLVVATPLQSHVISRPPLLRNVALRKTLQESLFY